MFRVKISLCVLRLGKRVGAKPWLTIILSLILSAVCLLGLLNFQKEGRIEKMWVPEESQALKDKVWVEARFPEKFHSSVFILQHDNVLTVEILQKVKHFVLIVCSHMFMSHLHVHMFTDIFMSLIFSL